VIAQTTPIRRLTAWEEELPREHWLVCVECGVVLTGVGTGHQVGGFDGADRWCRHCADQIDLVRVA
jgi:hypothetical protein